MFSKSTSTGTGLALLSYVLLWSLSLASPDYTFNRESEPINRRTSCSVAGFAPCPQPGLPDDFCCPSAQVCLSMAAQFTIICCPKGSDCASIEPISCDIQQQNATSHPDSLVKSTDLSSSMNACGGLCCPFGYDCNTIGVCTMFAEQKSLVDAALSTLVPASSSTVPHNSLSSSTATSSNISTASSVTTTSSSTFLPANTGSPAPTEPASNGSHSVSISTSALAGGIIAIVIVIAASVAFLFWFLNKKRKSTSRKQVEELSVETHLVEKANKTQSGSRSSFRKAELDNSSWRRYEMEGAGIRRELDGSKSTKARKSKFSIRELEGDASHRQEVSGEGEIHEMGAGGRSSQQL